MTDTLRSRFAGLNRRGVIRVGLPLGMVLRLDGITRRTGASREEAITEAIGDWTAKRESSLKRRDRLELEKRLQLAMQGVPLERLTKDFFAQSGDIRPAGVIPSTSNARLIPMPVLVTNLKTRRLSVGLSQQGLAEAAQCSVQVLRAYENGIVPQRSAVLPRIEQALTSAEETRSS